MTVVAVVAACNVRRVFPGRRDAVVTGSAGSNYLRMIDGKHRQKGEGAVTVFADIACLNMGRALANSGGAVVTRYAVSCDTRMIESRRQPACRAVAIIALIIARYVAGGFPRRLCAIVAIDAAAG